MNAKPSIFDRVACWSWQDRPRPGDWLLLAGFFAAFGALAVGASLLVSARTGATCSMEERGHAH
ncbi:MAG: hypothetical protein IPL47_08030 [Phyllobacteriaceae bacterium]|nr:hypothetical protein [Phyllobacteriaceae bacterium]